MESKIIIKKQIIIWGIVLTGAILLIIGFFLIFKINEPKISYEYYINDIKSDILGTNLVRYDCNKDITILYDKDVKALSHSKLDSDTKCNLYFEDSLGNYIFNYAYAKDDDTIYNEMDNVIGYTGENPNNYVYFNCDDYSNKDTCEVWRILEVVKITNEETDKYRLKLIRNDALMLGDITKFIWANKGTNEGFSTANIGTLLNNGYYNSLSDYEYASDTTVLKLDFSKIGLKNDKTRNMLSTGNFKMISEHYENGSADGWYKNENFGINIDVLVGLPTISDYVLTKMDTCKNVSISNFKTCSEKSYLDKNEGIWLLNYDTTNNGTYPFHLENGSISSLSPTFKYLIYPTLYLKSDVMYKGGNGTLDNPYLLNY